MPALPTGTVTFLFTDIEGSTRLLRELGDSYAQVLAEHRRLLRVAFAAHSGVELGTEGDSFAVAFARASDALSAAAEGQRMLRGGPVRVRMGLHTGEPLVTVDGYVGIDVHRAARIAAIGHGGQVLVSKVTRDLAGMQRLRDLGLHRLKDMPTPEHLYQLETNEFDSFPRLRSLYQTNIQAQPNTLIGRSRELEQILALARSAQVLTLSGPGGCGKTRMAIAAGTELLDSYPDGVWFVPLSGVTDVTVVNSTIASALDTQEDLVGFLRSKDLLLILDNLEQLLPGIAPVVAALVAWPGTRVLTTSRERLSISAEQVYPVPELALEQAVDLFTARARQLNPSFEADEDVRRIASHLGGLPLAIELAAARVNVLTNIQIMDRLGSSLHLLTSGSRDAPARQRSLRSTIDWSYALLTDHEKEVFASLGAFRGSFDEEAAAATALADLDVLSSLIDKSLLQRTEDGRFLMVDMLREYARLVLDARADRDIVRRRHAEHFLAFALPPDWSLLRQWQRAMDQSYSDFRAALGWLRDGHHPGFPSLVARLGLYWIARDLLEDSRVWLNAAIGLSTEGSPDQVRMAADLARLEMLQGNVAAARSAIQLCLLGSSSIGDEKFHAWAVALGGLIECEAGDAFAGRRALERAWELESRIGNRNRLAQASCRLGWVAIALDESDNARTHADTALAAARHNPNPSLEIDALGLIGYVAVKDGQLAEASKALARAFRLAQDIGSLGHPQARDLYTLALTKALSQEPEVACVLVGAADDYYRRIRGQRDRLGEQARAEVLRIVDETLESSRMNAERKRGEAMSLEQALAYACTLT